MGGGRGFSQEVAIFNHVGKNYAMEMKMLTA